MQLTSQLATALAVALSAFSQAPAQSSANSGNAPPEEPGVWVQAPTGWVQMARAPQVGTGRAGELIEFAGPHAKIQVSTTRPVFFVRYIAEQTMGDNAHLSRVLWDALSSPTGSVGILPLPEKDKKTQNRRPGPGTMPVAIEPKQLDKTLASITPKEELVHAEYLILVTGAGVREWLDFGVAPSGPTAEGVATVNVYREAGGLKPSVFVNGEEWLRLPSNTRATLKLSPGTYSIQADSTTRRVTSLTVEAGRVYYLKYHISLTNRWFDVIDASTGELEFPQFAPVEADLIKNKDRVVSQ